MRTPNWTDGIYINAALINPAFADATKAATESASVWAIPGLVHPEVVTWGAAGLTVSGTMPPPFSLLCASGGVSGLVANAHGVVDGQDSQSFSVNLAPLVPVSGPSITAYIYAASGIISQTPTTIVGPPQGNPAYNPNFVPFVSYTEQVATVVVSAAAAVPTGGFVLASIPLASGQSSISVASLSFAGQDLAAVAPTVAFQNLSGSNTLTLSQAGFALMVESSATTQTLPPANTANGRVFRVIAGFVSGTATVTANGSDLIYGFSNTGVGQGSISLPPGSRVALVGNGNGWLLESHSGLLPISWDFLGTPPAPISITPGGVTLPYPTTVDGSGNGNTLTLSDSLNSSQGAGILLKGNGPTTPNKAIRASSGKLSVVNSSYTTEIATIDDTGNLTTQGGIFANENSFMAGLTATEAINGGKGEQLGVQGGTAGTAAIIRMTCPNYFNVYQRVDTDGTWNLVNSSYTTQIFSVDQSGNVVSSGGIGAVGNIVADGSLYAGSTGLGTTFASTLQRPDGGGILLESNSYVDCINIGGSANVPLYAAPGASGNQVVNFAQFPFVSGTSGYMKLPSGFILQWGQETSTGVLGVNFPITFPNVVFSIVICECEANGGTWGNSHPTLHGAQFSSQGGFFHWVNSWNGSNWILGTATGNWIAIGY